MARSVCRGGFDIAAHDVRGKGIILMMSLAYWRKQTCMSGQPYRKNHLSFHLMHK